VFFVEHDLEVVMRHAEHVIVMAAVRSSPTERRRWSEAMRASLDAYLGTRAPAPQGRLAPPAVP